MVTTAGIDRNAVLNQASVLAGRGQLAEAIAVVEIALARQADAVLHAAAGTLALRANQFDRAVRHLRVALTSVPEDRTIRANLVEALAQLGRDEEVLQVVPESRAINDPTQRLARFRAHAAQQVGQFDSAVNAYRYVVANDPSDWSSWNNLGNALTSLERHEEAVEVLRRAAALVPDSAPVGLNLSRALLELDDPVAAEETLLKLTKLHGDDPLPWVELAALYKAAGREDPSFEALRTAIGCDPDNAELQADFGQEASYRNEFDIAAQAFERAIDLKPQLGAGWQGLANVFERTNREEELVSLLQKAESAGVDSSTRSFIRSLNFKRDGRFEEALREIGQIGEIVIPARKKQLTGQLLDRLGRYDEAWDEFSTMNQCWEDDPTEPVKRGAEYRAHVDAATKILTREWIGSWSAGRAPAERPSPVFLVGFPRSGTTLLDTLLMGHPDVQVLEEEPFIAQIEHELGGLPAFPSLDAAALDAAQRSYFDKVRESIDLRPDSLLVDKQPLHLNKVAVIRRIFPEARFILALRHPLDVLLSCFVTNFRPNPGMASFLRLEDAARLYHQTFTLWEKSRAVFAMPTHTIVYEEMIQSPEAILQSLVQWLGLDWHEDILDHQTTAKGRGHISTASYSQVTEPIYTRSKERWVRYAKHLEPIIPIIRPWADKYGYII